MNSEITDNTLVLCAGKNQRIQGACHHDLKYFDGIECLFDLNDRDWFKSPNIRRLYEIGITRIVCRHGVEHLNSLVNFMNNCHKLLAKGGTLEIMTPNAGANPDLEFCDPTHVRCYRPGTFTNYFTPEGIEKFGYTNRAWKILELKTIQVELPDDVIVFKGTPIK